MAFNSQRSISHCFKIASFLQRLSTAYTYEFSKLNAFHFSSLHTFLAVNLRISLLHTAERTEKQFIILKNEANGFL